jgi:hypothetical protein
MLPIAALLPVAGATIGGITGYRQSGGNLGAAALGAGLGAMTPGGFRMAGQALGTGLLGKSALGQIALSKAAKGVALSQADKALLAAPAAAGLAAGGLGLLATPALAGSPAAAVARPAQQVAGAAGSLGLGAMQPGQADYSAGAAVPGGLPVGASPATALEVIDPSGRFGAARTAELLQQDVALAGMRKIMPELFKAAEARSKTEFQRQMAAAGVRQNIATAANMLERSQQAAQQMGLTAAQQAGSALTQQYQYS